VFGSKHTHDRLVRELCAGSGAAAVFPTYYLSPGARYPLAIEENYAVVAHLADYGVGAEMGLDELAAQLLVYPVTDASFGAVLTCSGS
jgi:acetyl esterase/lipase